MELCHGYNFGIILCVASLECVLVLPESEGCALLTIMDSIDSHDSPLYKTSLNCSAAVQGMTVL